ncbi:uncharacterized protein B0I36DRAFT_109508 [Microdochium trichocladiopsis]|uniref:ZW10 C-terminal helical domain-containing protein n=1 Tax=Microdochium trichocladiopsis TaxID=1682393 RepID=A0A9P8Y9J2_9PEZI|nr:uncharacterized protein B0I36DRAFT_109508 [Microdochium trichocladiopsis]KAH7033468.1 hypothetical protein B0I36DRAFT_109508 [Microdochium trichocladiopsis]
MTEKEAGQAGQALVEFALSGAFPEEPLSSQRVTLKELGPALEALAQAKSRLESEIHSINEETAPEVSQWAANAKSLEEDINRSRAMANDIVRRSEAPDVSGKTIREAEDKVSFLQQETAYNQQVRNALVSIKNVNEILDKVEIARDERRILDSLHLLESAWTALDRIPVSKSCRVMKILNMRAFELKSAVHDVFNHVWSTLVQVDAATGTASVSENVQDEPMSLADAVIGLKAYKEVDQRMALLWHALDAALIQPRTHTEGQTLPTIKEENSSLKLHGQTNREIPSLFHDLAIVLTYLSGRLPVELIHSLSNVMMPDLIPRVISTWLDPAVPVSLADMGAFQSVTDTVRAFCKTLDELHYTGFSDLQEWVESSPRVWLSKCRETALDSVRSKLSQGLGSPQEVERVETQQVSKSEGKELTAATPAATKSGEEDDDWGAAWEADAPLAQSEAHADAQANEDDGTDAWGWGEEDDVVSDTKPKPTSAQAPTKDTTDDDGGDAWGWGDDEGTAENTQTSQVSAKPTQTRELTLRETYTISAMPAPVLALISTILEDGASLASDNANPVASAVAGLFSLPTLVLAMFRAVSPYYYSLSEGGNMFLYNDVTYLSEELGKFTSAWKTRKDLAPRAVTMLRLDNDIQTLQSFAARAYATEMTTQRTIIRDLLGGSQNLLQQDGLESTDLEAQVDGAIGRIRSVAATWKTILAPSAWNQAVGSLVDTIASKLISDVMDLAGIGQDEAYNIATMIAHVEKLDDLFPGVSPGDPATAPPPPPQTAQFASSWLRLKYLSEVLQSNLQDILWLWKDSGLSLEFSVGEVVDLIRLSFVDNARTRDVIRQIEANPHPQEGTE